MSRECIFCGGNYPLTKEHVFAMWLSLMLTPPPGKRYYLDWETDIEKRPRRYPVTVDLQVKQVCENCNGGWLSQIEQTVRRIIKRMQEGATVLSQEEQLILATWATKTAITLQYTKRVPAVPVRRRKWLYEHQTPPPDTGVWMATYTGDRAIRGISQELFINQAETEATAHPNGQLVTFIIGSVMFIVITFYVKTTISIRYPPRLQEHLLAIWPATGSILPWPAEHGVSNDLFSVFGEVTPEVLVLLHPTPPGA